MSKLKGKMKSVLTGTKMIRAFSSAFSKGGNAYGKEMRRVTGLSFKNRLDIIDKIPALKMVTKELREKFAQILEPKLFARGELIIKEGDVGDAFYIIETGSVVCIFAFCFYGG